MSESARVLRQRLADEAHHRCGYCLTLEVVSGIPLTLEHIIPKARRGETTEDNLWLSCRLCNEAKGVQVEGVDPQTGKAAPLFNPRHQVWLEHFIWSEDGTQIIGQTSVGRATVVALSLNSELRLRARTIWVEAGWHPPKMTN